MTYEIWLLRFSQMTSETKMSNSKYTDLTLWTRSIIERRCEVDPHDRMSSGQGFWLIIDTGRDSEITASCIIYPLKLNRNSSATDYLRPGDAS